MDFHSGTKPILGSIVGCVSFNSFEANLEHLWGTTAADVFKSGKLKSWRSCSEQDISSERGEVFQLFSTTTVRRPFYSMFGIARNASRIEFKSRVLP